jgi:hypothetical protein
LGRSRCRLSNSTAIFLPDVSDVYLKNVYFCMIFTFVFFFERSMQIPVKIPTGSIQDKEIEYFTFSYLHGSCLFILWLHCGFCNKKGNIWDFYRILPSPNVRDVG